MEQISELTPASILLKGISEQSGIPMNQLTFLTAQLIGMALAYIMFTFLNPKTTTTTIRLLFEIMGGIVLAAFAYGPRAIHIFILSVLCFSMICFLKPNIVQRFVLGTAMIYLSAMHLSRLIFGPTDAVLDITGPLMVLSQKTTSLAFAIHDGYVAQKNPELIETDKRDLAVFTPPSPLEFFSYALHFQTLMAGPIVFYRKYVDFIEGSASKDAPSPVLTAVRKILVSLGFAMLFVGLTKRYDMRQALDDEFFERSLFSKLLFLGACITVIRFKYYHAWVLADGICNLSGLGYGGMDENGKPKWDLVTNVNIKGVEMGLSPRETITQWNKGTQSWLRYIVYERSNPAYRTMLTFIFSASWHGFYPGYFITFLTGVMVTRAARVARKHIRPFFQTTRRKQLFYDFVTFVATRTAVAYSSFSFVILDFWPSIRIYSSMYFWFHVTGICIIIFVPLIANHWENREGLPKLSVW